MPFRYTGDYFRRQMGDYSYQGGIALAAFAAPVLKKAAGKLAPRVVGLAKRAAGFLKKPSGLTRGAATAVTGVAATAAYRAGARTAARSAAERFLERGPDGGECPPGKKRRRMNVANPRALRRAIRRAQGFAKLARKVLTFTSARAPRGRAKFRRRR